MAKAKKTADEKINIYIDPALKAEMEAEAKKSPEQRKKEQDEFMNILFSQGMGLMQSMKPRQQPVKKLPDHEPIETEIDEYEF